MNVKNVENIIRNIELISDKEVNAYKNILAELSTIERFPVLLFEHENLTLFRSRTFSDKTLISEISEIGPTPSKYINSFGRCNIPQQTKFYLSENRPTSYIELVEYWSQNKSVGETVYVATGRWEVLKSLKSIIITSPDLQDRANPYDMQNGVYLDQFIKNTKDEDRDATKLLYKYFFQKFRNSSKSDLKNYLITSAISNHSFSIAGEHADAIQYPSVPFGGNGDNFAINEEFYNNGNLKLLDVLNCELKIESENENGTLNFYESYHQSNSSIDYEKSFIEW